MLCNELHKQSQQDKLKVSRILYKRIGTEWDHGNRNKTGIKTSTTGEYMEIRSENSPINLTKGHKMLISTKKVIISDLNLGGTQ